MGTRLRRAYAFFADDVPSAIGFLAALAIPRRSAKVAIEMREPFDPARIPLVMIHGLGSGPATWRALAASIECDRELRGLYQVWLCDYTTTAPVLICRYLLAMALSSKIQALEHHAGALACRPVVLIGHSMGGVIARLLVSSSGDVLWNAAFAVPPSQLEGPVEDRILAERVFRFDPWPLAVRAILIAAPHRGAPLTEGWVGRLGRRLEQSPLHSSGFITRIARANPLQVREAVRASLQRGGPKSIETLSSAHPVASLLSALPTSDRVKIHVIGGVSDWEAPEPGDGTVPLTSARWQHAASELIVRSTHSVHHHPDAIQEIKRILRENAYSTLNAA